MLHLITEMYKRKYNKYKTKYINPKRSCLNVKTDKRFYFIHSTMSYQNLFDVQKTGILYPVNISNQNNANIQDMNH